MRKRAYLPRTKLSNYKFRQLVRCFALDLTSTNTAKFLKINRNTTNRIFKIIRLKIIESIDEELLLSGEIELDESYFGARRVRGKRGRGAKGKTIVFGLLKRNGRVITQVVENCSKDELLPIIRGKILSDSTVYTDGFKSYDSLVTLGYKHYRIYHSKDEFARGKNHVNGVESFWAYAKHRMTKFKGFSKEYFILHLKESEFRFNNRDKDLDQLSSLILKLF